MRAKHKRGDLVRISRHNDNENYEKFQGERLRITHVATKYMNAREFFATGKPDGYHPGFDRASNSALYDLETENGAEVPFSLYEWELEDA